MVRGIEEVSINSSPFWSDAEKAALRKVWGMETVSNEDLLRVFFGRTLAGIRWKARALGLPFPRRYGRVDDDVLQQLLTKKARKW